MQTRANFDYMTIMTIARIGTRTMLFGYPKSGRKHEGSATFRLFSSEVEKVLNIADLNRPRRQTAII